MMNNEKKLNNLTKSFVVTCVVIMTCVCLLTAAGVVTFSFLFNSYMRGNPERNINNITYSGDYSERAADIADMMGANVVEIYAGSSRGTGFVITHPAGGAPIILTNYHVVEKASSYYAKTVYESSYNVTQATLLGYDEYHDVAVLRLPNVYVNGSFIDLLDAAGEGFALGSFFAPAVTGEYLVAIGNALGDGLGIYDGICSVGSKAIHYEAGKKCVPVFQTTAAINSGMSGGPIFNSYGQIVGIGTYKVHSTTSGGSTISVDDMNYAVPISIALEVYKDAVAVPARANSKKEVHLLSHPGDRSYDVNITMSAVGDFSSVYDYTVNVFGKAATDLKSATLQSGIGFSGILLTGYGDGNTGLKVTKSNVNNLYIGDIITVIGDAEVTADYGGFMSALYRLEVMSTTYDASAAVNIKVGDKMVEWRSGSNWLKLKV